ncbi:MAG: excisionase [Candidatus Faecousia sp.]|nr:excisionase [Candidatus Faecousia sp.]
MEQIPVNQKVLLTIPEASALTNIGINRIYSMANQPNCPFVVYVGIKRLIKREKFEEFLSNAVTI